MRKPKVLRIHFNNLTYIDSCNEKEVLLNHYLYPILTNRIGYLVEDIKDKFKDIYEITSISLFDKELFTNIRNDFIYKFFGEFYDNLDDKELKKDVSNYYKIILYADYTNRYNKPLNDLNNYINIDTTKENYESELTYTLLFPFVHNHTHRIFDNYITIFDPFLYNFPCMEVITIDNTYYCFNNLYTRRFLTKYRDKSNNVAEFFIYKEDFDESKSFNNIMTEFNYYNHFNILPTLEVENGKVKILQ